VGLDLGDRFSQIAVLDVEGELVEESRVATTESALRQRFSGCGRMRIALETGTHSPWVSRVLADCGHEVVVANSRKLRLIYENRRKSDKVDALYLARLARLDPKLLAPVEHRGAAAQNDLALLRSRDALVATRTLLINHARGLVKSFGKRLPKCSSRAFQKRVAESIPQPLGPGLQTIVETIASVTEAIKQLERRVEAVAEQSYPETKLLRQVGGVGPITSLAYVLTIEDPKRFSKSRSVGPFLGLVPGRMSSGDSEPQMRITKEGDPFLRRLLVNAAHYILGPFGPDCDLRRFGLKMAARGGKNAKKRALVAVARKLAVLLHRLWRWAEIYEPLYQQTRKISRRGKAA
jgi:Transposase and inactivated derivatives